LKEFLDKNNVRYLSIRHSPAYTAQETAALAHIPGRELAKTVMIKLDGAMAMAVLPATRRLDLELLAQVAGAQTVALASEQEFAASFPDCEAGAMPPFGNLYGMRVYVDSLLRDDEHIAFNAGSHYELIQMTYQSFARLVDPQVSALSRKPRPPA
jgi:Ala-tRNA(Pro) deacylase